MLMKLLFLTITFLAINFYHISDIFLWGTTRDHNIFMLRRIKNSEYNKFIMSWTSMFKWAVAHLNILVHDMINLLYYEYWTDKQKYLYV